MAPVPAVPGPLAGTPLRTAAPAPGCALSRKPENLSQRAAALARGPREVFSGAPAPICLDNIETTGTFFL